MPRRTLTLEDTGYTDDDYKKAVIAHAVFITEHCIKGSYTIHDTHTRVLSNPDGSIKEYTIRNVLIQVRKERS